MRGPQSALLRPTKDADDHAIVKRLATLLGLIGTLLAAACGTQTALTNHPMMKAQASQAAAEYFANSPVLGAFPLLLSRVAA